MVAGAGDTQEATGEVAGVIQAIGDQAGDGATQDIGEAAITATTITTTPTEEEVLQHIMVTETTAQTEEDICQAEVMLLTEATTLIETTPLTEVAIQQTEIIQLIDLATVTPISEELLQ